MLLSEQWCGALHLSGMSILSGPDVGLWPSCTLTLEGGKLNFLQPIFEVAFEPLMGFWTAGLSLIPVSYGSINPTLYPHTVKSNFEAEILLENISLAIPPFFFFFLPFITIMSIICHFWQVRCRLCGNCSCSVQLFVLNTVPSNFSFTSLITVDCWLSLIHQTVGKRSVMWMPKFHLWTTVRISYHG